MKHPAAFVLGALLCAGVSVASAQSLGDLARKEEARRKAIPAPAKVYTNDSLRTDGMPPAPAPAPAATPAPTPAAAKPAAPAAPSAPGQSTAAAPASTTPKDEAAWRKRIADARAAVERSKTFQDALQNRIDALSTDFVNRDDPAQRNQIAADRQKALTELDRVRQEIAKAQKDIVDIQEEARRAGLPAGWVR